MDQKYCISVEDVYGCAAPKVPHGWEFTGEFRPPLRGETYMGRTPGCWDVAITDGPRLILEKAPTVESVYMGQSMEQLKQAAQELEGFKWTGVFREVKDGDYILGAVGGNAVVRVVNRPDLIGKWRVIMEKVPTIKEIYGKELADLRAPDGWRFTGEFRNPAEQDSFLSQSRNLVIEPPYSDCNKISTGPRLILEKLPVTPTIKDVYGTDSPTIPAGWKFKEFRQVDRTENIHILGNNCYRALPVLELGFLYDRWRIVLEKKQDLSQFKATITPADIYGTELPEVPDGYRVVKFAPPKGGQQYLGSRIFGVTQVEKAFHDYGPTNIRFIVEPI